MDKLLILVITLLSLSIQARPIKVLVIDTGIYPHALLKKYIKDKPNRHYEDSNGHGTHIAGIVMFGDMERPEKKICENVELYSCKFFYNEKGIDPVDETIKCLRYALELKPDIINYSASGNQSSDEEKELIGKIINKGTKFLVAAGNNGINNNKMYFPAGYDIPGMIVVSNKDYTGSRVPNSNWQSNSIYEYGHNILSTAPDGKFKVLSGTSQATAMKTHKIIQEICTKE